MSIAIILNILQPILAQLVPAISAAITHFVASLYAAKDPARLADLVEQTVRSMAELAVPDADKRRQALADIDGAIQADATCVEGIAADEVSYVINNLIEKFALQVLRENKGN